MSYTISNVCQLINNLMLPENAIIAFTFGFCESSFNIIKYFKSGRSHLITCLSFPLMHSEIQRVGQEEKEEWG